MSINTEYKRIKKRTSEYFRMSEKEFENLNDNNKLTLVAFTGARENCREINNLLKQIMEEWEE